MRRSARRVIDPFGVFLNIPYDRQFSNLYLAFIAGLSAFGLTPRTTLEIPGGERRLDRIFDLIQDCGLSIHDLSRVQVDPKPPATPRFNMPFELGLAVAWAKVQNNPASWFIFESAKGRIHKSLSDLDGTDVYVHNGNASGVLRELSNALVRLDRRPAHAQMEEAYSDLREASLRIKRDAGAQTLFTARAFYELRFAARDFAGYPTP